MLTLLDNQHITCQCWD